MHSSQVICCCCCFYDNNYFNFSIFFLLSLSLFNFHYRCLDFTTMKMGLTASPLRRRGCLLILAFCVMIPFTLMMLFIGPGKHFLHLNYINLFHFLLVFAYVPISLVFHFNKVLNAFVQFSVFDKVNCS